jgi:pimeloyl-ACP methyl ester carboxylesterase
MIQTKTQFLKVSDGTLTYRSIGQGPTIVFIAGGPAVCGPLYEETLGSLTDKNSLVFWNYAGCSLSNFDRKSFSVIEDLADLENIVCAADRPVVLMGHSYGGLLGIKYAADHPENVCGLVLINSMPSFSHSKQSKKKKLDRLNQLGLVGDYMVLGEKVFSGIADENETKSFWHIEARLQVHDERFSSEISNKLTPSFATVINMQSDLMTIDYSTELKKLKIPILITAGLFDLIALDRPREMHSWLQNSTLHEYKSSGHSPFLEEKDLFIRQTGEWLKNNSLR